MGQIAFNAGIAKRFDCAAHKFLGHIPGGLAIATVAGATAFKAICGSVAATSTRASVAVPEMTKFGYAKGNYQQESLQLLVPLKYTSQRCVNYLWYRNSAIYW